MTSADTAKNTILNYTPQDEREKKDKELILRCAAETGAIVTAEEHTIYGGLGGAVSEVLAWGGAGVPTEFVGLQDTFTESGKYADLLHKYGVDADGVIAGIEKVLERKK